MRPGEGVPLPYPISKVLASTRRPVPARRIRAVCLRLGCGLAIGAALVIEIPGAFGRTTGLGLLLEQLGIDPIALSLIVVMSFRG